jgi:hypothetical protein
MQVAGNVHYGLGWVLPEWHGHPIWEHGGGIDGFNAHVALMPDQKLGMAILTNVSSSPLPGAAMEAVWEKLVGRPEKPAEAVPIAADAPAPTVDPQAEAGTYRLAEANMDVTVAWKEGKLMIQAPGQPEASLESVSGRRYKVGAPAPPGFFATFRPAKEDPGTTELFLELGEGGPTFALPKLPEAKPAEKPAAYVAPLSPEELMGKVIEALGGEANLRKHRSMVMKFEVEFENQGLTGHGTAYSRAPNAGSQSITLHGAGKKVGTMRDYFDGTAGGAEASFSPPAVKSGKQLADAAIAADFYPELNWKRHFKTVTIRQVDKVGDEEVYVVEKRPENGNPITEYVSTRSFLLLKRDSRLSLPGVQISLPVSETFSDYRAVDGVMLPFQRVQSLPSMGNTVIKVKDVRFDTPVPDSAFQPSRK